MSKLKRSLEEITDSAEKPKRFFHVNKVPMKENDFHQGYRIEVLEMLGDRITKRYFYDKTDTKQVVMAKLELINDPDNQEYETNVASN